MKINSAEIREQILGKRYLELESRNNLLENENNRQIVLRDTIELLVTDLSIQAVTQKVVNLMASKLGFAGGNIFLLNKNRNALFPSASTDSFLSNAAQRLLPFNITELEYPLDDAENLIVRSYQQKEMLTSQSLADFAPPAAKSISKVIQAFARIKSGLALPLIYQNKVVGVVDILSHKEAFEPADVKVLETFGNICAIVINNSNLYEESNRQVKQLEVQNKDLQSLYTLTSNVGRSLDPEKVAQTAVNSLPQDEDMLGAILSIYDPTASTLTPLAITENEISEKAKSIIGDFTKYTLDLGAPEVKQIPSVRVIETGEPQYSNDVGEALSPPLPKQVVGTIAKLLNVKSIVVYPVRSRGKIVGTITYFLKRKSFEELEENQKQLLSTYSIQISIALENANLFRQSQIIQRKLREARRQERDMIDVMGHELRTPISIVRNSLIMLDTQFGDGDCEKVDREKVRKYIDMGIESARREVRLIETLLSATKVEGNRIQLDLTKVDLLDVINDAIEGNKQVAEEKGLVIDYQPPAEQIYIYCDRVRVQEIMDNFLSNSIKYTQQGSISISAWADQQKSMGFISIKDTGIGIDAEDLKMLGRKFFRAKQYGGQKEGGVPEESIVRPGGTGLGLYVSFELLDIMHGIKDIQSKVGEGSNFTFGLPLFTGQADEHMDQTFMPGYAEGKEALRTEYGGVSTDIEAGGQTTDDREGSGGGGQESGENQEAGMGDEESGKQADGEGGKTN